MPTISISSRVIEAWRARLYCRVKAPIISFALFVAFSMALILDPNSLAWGILHTLQHPVWSHKRAENALHIAADVFNWRAIAASTVSVYRRVHSEWQRGSWGK